MGLSRAETNVGRTSCLWALRGAEASCFTGVMNVDAEDQKALESMTERLINRFPAVSPPVIREIVDDVLKEFDDARIRSFIPVLVNRAAEDRIRLLLAASDAHRIQPANA